MQRMFRMFRLLLTGLVCLTLNDSLHAQVKERTGCKPPISRQLRHDYVDREQLNALKADGKADNQFHAGPNEEVNFQLTHLLTRRIDDLQCRIEQDTLTRDQKKIGYLKGIERMLRNFTAAFRSRQILAGQLLPIMEGYEQAILLDREGKTIVPLVQRSSYEVGAYLIFSEAFDQNPSRAEARLVVQAKYLQLHPDQIFATLKDNPDLPGRDSLIRLAAYRYPRQLYDYAAANNSLAFAIRRIDDPLVRAVTRMATEGGSGQLYFPFLDNIMKGRMTIDDIDAVKNDPVKYYKLLVRTRVDYVNRQVQNRDTALEMDALTRMLRQKALDVFVRTINALHEEPDAKRFRILQDLSAPELYYLAVFGEQEIYTSSFIKGVYPALMAKAGNRGDSLMMMVSFDRFKKFIKMTAGYNTLSEFLKTFPDQGHAEKLMTEFVNGLEKTRTLEDGVDVADSYASIAETNKPLAARMLANVHVNYERNRDQGNRRGAIQYQLLSRLFASADTAQKVDLAKEFGIPPVYTLDYNSLKGDTNRVYIQVFFYGDKDGQTNYAGFAAQMAKGPWRKAEDTKQWTTWVSTQGRPMTVYANKALDEESGALEKAQAALLDHLNNKGIQPSVVIHRGHSYYAGYTIEQIQPAARLVFLGSCGGYHLIHDVLERAPDAHIIASKQIGKGVINQPFINLLFERLRAGRDIDWIPFWKTFEKTAGKTEGFEDYIPPHRNLGAIFIKACNSQMGEE